MGNPGGTADVRSSVAVLVKKREKFLTVTNRRWGGFSIPGGKLELGETDQEAARRELFEETGCKATSLNHLITLDHRSIPKDGDTRQWRCAVFIADIGDQQPIQKEEGTLPSWRSAEELVSHKDSLYPDLNRRLFQYYALLPAAPDSD